jgi:hypothetical protein
MIALIDDYDRYENDRENSLDSTRFERFSHRRKGEFPARSSASRIKARMRSRGGAAAKRKAREFNASRRSPRLGCSDWAR